MNGPTWRIAREEWRALARNRAGLIAALLVVALMIVAAMVSVERRAVIDSQRARYQATVDRQFDAQPDRHPHRMVHYGQFVFRPIPALAFFDSGVDGFTGNTVFLEGHRQNSANFSEARQSSLLLRFGLIRWPNGSPTGTPSAGTSWPWVRVSGRQPQTTFSAITS